MAISPLNPPCTVAFIGTGVMGSSMAGHLQKAGHRLSVFSRTRSKSQPLLDGGATWCDSPGAAAAQADAVVTIVGMPSDVESVYLGKGGIVESARPGTVLIDMTTSSPQLAQRIAQAGEARGQHVLDAPVSGGDIGAREARLSIMVGGSTQAFDAAKPMFDRMGKSVIRQGGPGAGQYTKMCNQIVIANNMLGVCESLAYAIRAGLDPNVVLQSISTGAAGSWSLANLGPRMLKGDFAPGFFVKHFIKDMKIAIESAREMKLDLPGLTQACRLYEQLAARGGENDGTQALFKLYVQSMQ
jgi:3-hydroxyisobutyrate dehydrogenase